MNSPFTSEHQSVPHMTAIRPRVFGINLRKERQLAGLTQAALSRQSGVNRIKILRMETGAYSPAWEEVLRLAQALRVPLQRFLNGDTQPSVGLKGIAFELYRLGIHDYLVDSAEVPGAFRRPEQVIADVLAGDCPEARLIDAMPLVLATQQLNAGLALAFADLHDRRVRARLAWLCRVTLAMGRMSVFPVPVRAPEELEKIAREVKKPAEPDDLGHPSSHRLPPLWLRWNITYGGTMTDFLARARDLAAGNGFGEEA